MWKQPSFGEKLDISGGVANILKEMKSIPNTPLTEIAATPRNPHQFEPKFAFNAPNNHKYIEVPQIPALMRPPTKPHNSEYQWFFSRFSIKMWFFLPFVIGERPKPASTK